MQSLRGCLSLKTQRRLLTTPHRSMGFSPTPRGTTSSARLRGASSGSGPNAQVQGTAETSAAASGAAVLAGLHGLSNSAASHHCFSPRLRHTNRASTSSVKLMGKALPRPSHWALQVHCCPANVGPPPLLVDRSRCQDINPHRGHRRINLTMQCAANLQVLACQECSFRVHTGQTGSKGRTKKLLEKQLAWLLLQLFIQVPKGKCQ